MSLDLENLNINDSLKITDNKNEDQRTDPRTVKIREKAREMESVFLSQMVKAMRKTVPKNSWNGTENQNNLPSMMFSRVMGKALAKSGGIGLADKIFNSLKEMDNQEIQKIQEENLEQNNLPINTFNFLKSNSTELNNE